MSYEDREIASDKSNIVCSHPQGEIIMTGAGGMSVARRDIVLGNQSPILSVVGNHISRGRWRYLGLIFSPWTDRLVL